MDLYRKMLIEQEITDRKRLANVINVLNSLDSASDIENVCIIEAKDSPRAIRELVIDFYDSSQARINIECNSIHAILKEYYSYVATGTALGLFYEGPKNEQ